MAMLEHSHATQGRVNGWAEIFGALAAQLCIMFQCCFYSDLPVYPKAVNKTLQSHFCSVIEEVGVPRDQGCHNENINC